MLLAAGVDIRCLTMHHTFLPFAVVVLPFLGAAGGARRKEVATVTLTLTVLPLADVALQGIGPNVRSLSMHLTVLELQ